MKFFRNFFRRMFTGLANKAFRVLLYIVIGVAVWCLVIDKNTHDKAHDLYEQGKELYRESSNEDYHSTETYDIRQDSTATYFYIKDSSNDKKANHMERRKD